MVVDLTVEEMGIRFPNPFLLASTPAATAEGCHLAAKAGWGGAVTWAVEMMTPEKMYTKSFIPRGVDYVVKPPQWWGFSNAVSQSAELNPEQFMSPEKVERLTRKAKEAGIPIGVNILEGLNPDAWGKDTAAAERGGADFVELNWSCPILPGGGVEIAVGPEVRRAIFKAVRDNCSLPIVVKLSAALFRADLEGIAKECVEAGAVGIATTNTIDAVAGVDIETGLPRLCGVDIYGKLRGLPGGLSGPAIKPIGLRAVAELRRVVDGKPISGIGGITCWEDAVEYMLLGASTVQIGTAAMMYGYRMIGGLMRGLQSYMEKKGFKRIQDFVGWTADRYAVGEPLVPAALEQPYKMVVDESRCDGCGICVDACQASSSQSDACQMVDRVARIDENLCRLCHCCEVVCPQKAISRQWEPGAFIPIAAGSGGSSFGCC